MRQLGTLRSTPYDIRFSSLAAEQAGPGGECQVFAIKRRVTHVVTPDQFSVVAHLYLVNHAILVQVKWAMIRQETRLA